MTALCVVLCIGGRSSLSAFPADMSFTVPQDTVRTVQDTLPDFVLQELTVVSRIPGPMVSKSGNAVVVSIQGMQNMPKFLGTADPMRYLQTLPGVQVNTESSAGIFIQGCEDHHTVLSIDGAPVFYPNHLLGLFSSFIPAHFEDMEVETSCHDAAFPNRLGGGVSLYSYTGSDRSIGIEGNVGLISSELTVPVRFGDRGFLSLSARSSYIGLLYSSLLSFDGMDVGYEFQDFNLTGSWAPGDNDRLVLSAFFGMDGMSLENNTSVSADVDWSNLAASLSWRHSFRDNSELNTTARFSGYLNRIYFEEQPVRADAGSDVALAGVESGFRKSVGDRFIIDAGVEWNTYLCHPLALTSEGLGVTVDDVRSLDIMHEFSVYAGLTHDVSEHFRYEVGLRPSLWLGHDMTAASIDPRVTLHFPINDRHELRLHYGRYSQALHKAALFDGGLPADYFFLSDKTNVPERSHSVSLGYTGSVPDKSWAFTAELYFKQLYNVIESSSDVVELVFNGFDYQKDLLYGDGRNFGFNAMIQKNKGYVKGYISYSLGWALRNFPEITDRYDIRADHDRRHNLVVALSSQPARNWSLGAMFVLASGAPYSEAVSAYYLNGHVIYEYGPHNGATMPLYHRLDLSCSYYIIKSMTRELSVNLSLYNVYAHKNVQFILASGKFMRHVSVLPYPIPSLSVSFRF